MEISKQVIIDYALKIMINPLVWVLILFIVASAILGFLYIKKKRKLEFIGIEKTAYGYNTGVKCGWFGQKQYLKMLYTTGTELMYTDQGEVIEGFEEDCFTEIDGERGFLFYRDPRTQVLIAIKDSKLDEESKALILNIPDKVYYDTGKSAQLEVIEETKDLTAQIITWASIVFVAIALVVAVIIISQMNKTSAEEITKRLADGDKLCAETAQTICSKMIEIKSNAP